MDDTSPGAHEVYWARLRAMTPAERAAVGTELSELSEQMVRAGVRTRYPDAGPEEFLYQLLRAKYGEQVADKACGRTAGHHQP